jgi:hypothetical protein
MEGCSFPRAFERRHNFLFREFFYEEFERYVKKTLYIWVAFLGPRGH